VDAPVARVAVDVPHPHLDRLFDYAVPAELDEPAAPGVRVRVRFAGRLTAGFVLARVAASEHEALTPLGAVVSPEPVLSTEVAALARAVADRMAGTLADVLRLAVPPRHARAEATASAEPAPRPPPPAPRSWSRFPAGPALLEALAAGRSPRAVWAALPGDWPDEVARAVAATLAAGRGAVVVAPDAGDVARVDAALGEVLGAGQHVVLTADLGPAERYRRFLAARRGAVRAVVGTRAAAFAPVRDLGLVAVWDDGNDVLDEPRAPYCNARDVLVLRAHLAGAAALVGGYAPSVEAAQLVARGWAAPLLPARSAVRAATPRVSAAGEDAELARDPAARAARLPTVAWSTARRALADGPVLVQVPRRGYQPALRCQDCRAPARCPACGGPLGRGAAAAVPACRWCGRPSAQWRCRECSGERLRAAVVGSRRTAEELGRSFPGVPVRTSGGDDVLAAVGPEPTLVVATPGAEPGAPGGYAAALLLDGWALLGRPGLRAAEEALRRWANAAALVRAGCPVVVLAEAGVPAVQALVRWDPLGHAEREAADRAALRFPPASRLAVLDASPAALAEALEHLGGVAEVLGPVPLDADRERAVLRVPRGDGRRLAAALHELAAGRSARKAPAVRIQLDPREPL
jgi:primosomal protein N' (replication factor Y)